MLATLLALQAAALHHRAWPSEMPARADSTRGGGKYGFYLHTFRTPKASIHVLRQLRSIYPEAPVYVMSDGGMNFTGICREVGNCNFQWRPPARDAWNPKPFFARFKEAARWLGTEYVVMLEPDVAVQGLITKEPSKEHAAGGLRDNNRELSAELRDYMEELGRKSSGNPKFELPWDRFGLAGGMYVRTEAAMKAFDTNGIDWEKCTKLDGARIFSSDIAMAIALAAKGYTYYPWEDVTQLRYEKVFGTPKHTPALRHYGKDEAYKPFYDSALTAEEKQLVTEVSLAQGIAEVNCKGCVWASDSECWKQVPMRCPTEGPRSDDWVPPGLLEVRR